MKRLQRSGKFVRNFTSQLCNRVELPSQSLPNPLSKPPIHFSSCLYVLRRSS